MSSASIDQVIQGVKNTGGDPSIAAAIATAKRISSAIGNLEALVNDLRYASGSSAAAEAQRALSSLKKLEASAVEACLVLAACEQQVSANNSMASKGLSAHANLLELAARLSQVDDIVEKADPRRAAAGISEISAALEGSLAISNDAPRKHGARLPQGLPKFIRVPLGLALLHFCVSMPLLLILGLIMPFLQIILTPLGMAMPHVITKLMLLVSLLFSFPLGLFFIHHYGEVSMVYFGGVFGYPLASLTFGIVTFVLGKFLLRDRMARTDLIFLTVACFMLAIAADFLTMMEYLEGVKNLEGFYLGLVLLTQLPLSIPALFLDLHQARFNSHFGMLLLLAARILNAFLLASLLLLASRALRKLVELRRVVLRAVFGDQTVLKRVLDYLLGDPGSDHKI